MTVYVQNYATNTPWLVFGPKSFKQGKNWC